MPDYQYKSADGGDPHRSWTAQSGEMMPGRGDFPTTRFHPDELPDPEKALEMGLKPQVFPAHLVDEAHRTQSPLGEAVQGPPSQGESDAAAAAAPVPSSQAYEEPPAAEPSAEEPVAEEESPAEG